MFLTPKKISPTIIAPNFIIGYGRTIDIAANFNKMPAITDNNNKDIEALAYDWEMVENDLYNSILLFNEQNNL
jgi:hypothetical protein